MKPLDLSRLRKAMTKNHNLSDGFHDPDTWIDTGNYTLNYLISSSFFKGMPLGKVGLFAGESGSAKSYIVSGNLVRNIQQMGGLPILLDSEYALDEKWMNKLGVDTHPDRLMRFPVAMVDDCANVINEVMKDYVANNAGLPRDQQQKILFVIDSLGALATPTEVDQFNRGDMKGDMGRKPRQLKALVMQALKMFGAYQVGLVATQHSYKSQDAYSPDDVISGGAGFIYAASIVVLQTKLKLKMTEEGEKVSEVLGIRAKIKVLKSRYAKPFEEVEITIPWDGGMNPYSGLFELFEKMGIFTREGNSYLYTDLEGNLHKKFQKAWKKDHEGLQMVMRETEIRDATVGPALVGVDESPELDDTTEAAD